LSPIRLLSRAERAHWRLSWAERLARNARSKNAPEVSIRLFGIPDAFATALGLRIA
jgi:Zn-dependent protease with chaperone function